MNLKMLTAMCVLLHCLKYKGIFKPFVKLFHGKLCLFINPLLSYALSKLNVVISYTYLPRVNR